MEQVYKKTGILFKLLPCLLATIIAFMTLYGSFVYGFTVENDSETIELPEINDIVKDYNYYFIMYNQKFSPFCYYLYLSNTPFYVSSELTESNEHYTFRWVRNNGSYSSYSFNPSSDTDWVFANTSSYNPVDSFSSKYQPLLYNNYDILDEESNVVFQAPTQEVGTQGIIAEQTQGVQMDKTLQEILGILPVVLVVIVALIAIRKGIAMIRISLKKS